MYRPASTVLFNVLLAVGEHEANGTAVPNRIPVVFSKLHNGAGMKTSKRPIRSVLRRIEYSPISSARSYSLNQTRPCDLRMGHRSENTTMWMVSSELFIFILFVWLLVSLFVKAPDSHAR